MAIEPQNTTTSSFAQRTEQTRTASQTFKRFAGQAKFYPDNIRKTLQELGTQMFPNNEYNNKAYQEAIVMSLTNIISPEIGIRDFWSDMTDHEAEIVRIENGFMKFYNAENQQIDITQFTQPIVFEAYSSYYKQRQKERKIMIELAKQQLDQLKNEIHKR